MKITFEGTEKQIENLKELTISGNNNFPKISENPIIYSYWSTQDVLNEFECTEQEALEILDMAMTDELAMEAIWFSIKHYALERKLTKKI
jgi:hypothetical protein